MFLASFAANAQDTLFFKNSNKIIVKVSEVTPTQIKYKRYDNLDGPLYSSLKSEISYIIYATGLKETLEGEQPQTAVKIPSSSSEEESSDGLSYFEKGKSDAKIYYKHNGGSIGTGIGTVILSPLVGWIPPLIINSFKPRERNLNMPDKNISRNKLYQAGYREQAYKIKRKKNWKAFGIGSLIYTGIYILLRIK